MGGQIAHYSDEEIPTAPRKLPQLIAPRARVQGPPVIDFAIRFGEASERLAGDDVGKQVVRVSSPE